MLHSDLTEGKHSAYCASASTFGPAPSEPQERRWQRPKMRPPAVPDQPIPILSEPQLRTLFAACAGKDFDARRDTALLMVLLDAGPRRAELLGMRVEDLDFEYDVVRVIGKGRRERALPFGRKTAMALDRYLRARSRHRRRESPSAVGTRPSLEAEEANGGDQLAVA